MNESLAAGASRTRSTSAASTDRVFQSALADMRRITDDVLAGVRAGRTGSLQLPMPLLVSRDWTRITRDYLIWWITNPDPAGTFAARTRWLRWLPAPLLLRMLFALGYDGLVYVKDEVVVGHVFFQRRGSALHGFSTAVSERFAGSGYSVAIARLRPAVPGAGHPEGESRPRTEQRHAPAPATPQEARTSARVARRRRRMGDVSQMNACATRR
jgi:hypothetical protein